MSERKTRKPKANAKRPPAGPPSPGTRKANRPRPARRNPDRPRRANAKAAGAAKPVRPHAAPGNGTGAAPKANAATKAKPKPKPKPKPKRRPGPKPGTPLMGRSRGPGRGAPSGRRPRKPSAGPDLAKVIAAAAARAQSIWATLSPKAKAGAAATATVTARLAKRSGSGVLGGIGATARFANKHRRTALQVLHRVAWWSAWAMMLIAGRNLVAFEQSGSLPAEQMTFLWGLGLCAFVVATAAERRMRTGALALGGAHALAAAILIAG